MYSIFVMISQFSDFRGYMNDNYPTILEYFYKSSEWYDKDKVARIREIDAQVWANQKNK